MAHLLNRLIQGILALGLAGATVCACAGTIGHAHPNTVCNLIQIIVPVATQTSYTNPVYAGDMPDPTVIKYHGVYYAFGTTGSGRIDGKIFTLLRSTNLITWEKLGGALNPPSDNPDYQYWAPEVTFANGKFYLYYAMGGIEPNHFQNRVAASSTPEGPYNDTGNVLVDCQSNQYCIDPFPFRDDDGQWYFFYSAQFPQAEGDWHPGSGIVVDRLIDMTKLAGDCHVVVRGKYEWTRAGRSDWHVLEGPCVLKHNGKYYCIYSGNGYRSIHYGLDFVVADHPLGPYTDQGDSARVLHDVAGHVRGPGHNDVVIGPDGRTQYVVYHAWNEEMTRRQMCIDKLIWTAQGPKCEGPTYTAQPAP